jgi:general secretion pathway protein D
MPQSKHSARVLVGGSSVLKAALLLVSLLVTSRALAQDDQQEPPPPPPQGQRNRRGGGQGGSKAPGGGAGGGMPPRPGGGPMGGAPGARPPGTEEEAAPTHTGSSGPGEDRQKPPVIMEGADSVMMDFVNTDLQSLVKYMAEVTGRNFIISDDLKGNITIISHKPVTINEAYEAFISALSVAGYTTVGIGKSTKIVKTSEAANAPVNVYNGGSIPSTDNYVTQIIQLENVSVTDVSTVVKSLAGKSASIVSYAPTNTLIITDAATNIRRVYKIVSQLDVASPKSKIAVIPIEYATASEVQSIIEEIYGTEDTASTSSSSSSAASSRSTRSTRRTAETTDTTASETKVGEGKFIQKIISDERTNSLVVQANEEALKAILELVEELDVDVDPEKNAKIHVIYLEHASAETVADVLANLANSSSSGSSSSSSSSSTRRTTTSNTSSGARPTSGSSSSRSSPTSSGGGMPGRQALPGFGAARGGGGGGTSLDGTSSTTNSVVAAFDEGTRVTYDESTNSLVIIATNDQYKIIQGVIEKLDIPRKQVFVEGVILELASQDNTNLGVAWHVGNQDASGGLGVIGSSLGGVSSLAVPTSLSALSLGVFGPSTIPVVDPTTGNSLTVPAFGIALEALQENGAVNILSTPNVLTMDNEQAKIIVGKNIPFPISTGRDSNNNPIVSYQREDVAITLQVTPQINESNYVTLELFQEVQEVEEGTEDSEGGPTTTKRSAETVVVVQDNQTVVIGGLIGSTDTDIEQKIPILGDLPLVGNLFRSKQISSRKTNLLIFLTPHIVEKPEDLEEVYRVKMAQRDEYVRRFYGKSRDEQEDQIHDLLQYSVNHIDEPSVWRTKVKDTQNYSVIGTSGVEGSGASSDDPSTDSIKVDTQKTPTKQDGGNVLGPDELPDIHDDSPASGSGGTGTEEGQDGK